MKKYSVILLLIFSGLNLTLFAQNSDFFTFIDFRIKPLPLINSNESEISPEIVNGDLYFSSIVENVTRQESSLAFYDVYKTQINESGEPVSERELVKGFGNLYHEGPVSYCPNTGELFVTISNLPDNTRRLALKSRPVRLSLVVMKRIEGEWVVTYDFPFNHSEFNFAHPAIHPSGDTLVFSSDMDGGYGKSDLYMSVRKNGNWTEPVNLGERINTPGNEMFPTFGPGGMLFFSSNGHEPNYGQLDIYYTTLSGNQKPINPGNKLNSAFDDFGLVIHPSEKFGYFSSNRNSWRKDDIFQVEFFPLMENIRGKVIAHHNEEPVRDAVVYLQDCDGNQIKSVYSGFFGNFEFEAPKGACYQVSADIEGFSSELITSSGIQFIELRLKQIINYQLVVQDFENTNALGEAKVSCGELQWSSDLTGIISVKFDTIFDCAVKVSRDGYFDYSFDLSPERFGPGIEISDTVRLFRKETGRKFLLKSVDYYMDMWRLMPKSEPDLNHIVKLLKDNPTLRIEISAHTDSRLEDQYNMWLSQKRADSVLEYLVQNGAPKERIVAKGYGETRLLNHCANGVICSEALHLVNRRTEMVILEY